MCFSGFFFKKTPPKHHQKPPPWGLHHGWTLGVCELGIKKSVSQLGEKLWDVRFRLKKSINQIGFSSTSKQFPTKTHGVFQCVGNREKPLKHTCFYCNFSKFGKFTMNPLKNPISRFPPFVRIESVLSLHIFFNSTTGSFSRLVWLKPRRGLGSINAGRWHQGTWWKHCWDPGRGTATVATLQPIHCQTCNEPTETTSVELASPKGTGVSMIHGIQNLGIWSLICQPWSGLHKGTSQDPQKQSASRDATGKPGHSWQLAQPGTQSSSHLCRKTFPKLRVSCYKKQPKNRRTASSAAFWSTFRASSAERGAVCPGHEYRCSSPSSPQNLCYCQVLKQTLPAKGHDIAAI